jgi:hypothetical protein
MTFWRLAGAVTALGVAVTAKAATLIEARNEHGPLRIVVDRDGDRVRLSSGEQTLLFDLAAGVLYLAEGDATAKRVQARYRPGHEEPPPYRLEPYGRGPILADHISEYHVLFAEEQVCAELMLSAWMAPFVDPAVRALALLEQLDGAPGPDPCAAIPFAAYAAPGWPLLVGKRRHATFETLSVRFDYQPVVGELNVPADALDVAVEALGPLARWSAR